MAFFLKHCNCMASILESHVSPNSKALMRRVTVFCGMFASCHFNSDLSEILCQQLCLSVNSGTFNCHMPLCVNPCTISFEWMTKLLVCKSSEMSAFAKTNNAVSTVHKVLQKSERFPDLNALCPDGLSIHCHVEVEPAKFFNSRSLSTVLLGNDNCHFPQAAEDVAKLLVELRKVVLTESAPAWQSRYIFPGPA